MVETRKNLLVSCDLPLVVTAHVSGPVQPVQDQRVVKHSTDLFSTSMGATMERNLVNKAVFFYGVCFV